MSKRLQKEFAALQKDRPDWCAVSLDGDNLFAWKAEILGPENSPYEKGKFKLNIEIPSEYPFKAPKLKVMTKVYHPNITSDGSICMEIIADKWSPQVKIQEVLLTVRQLLLEPNPGQPLVAEIAEQFQKDHDKFEKTAREWTKKYAK